MEVSTPTLTADRRDPRTAAELEQLFPGRLWVLARKAAEHGWDVSVRPTATGWALYLMDEHHCIHLFWQPNVKANRGQYPWDLYRSSLATRCPNQSGRVHVRDLPEFLANHPDECEGTHTRRPLAELFIRPECADHLCPAVQPERPDEGSDAGDGVPHSWKPGDPFNDGSGIVEGYVVGKCGHRVAQSEWAAGFEHCERCS